MGQHMADRTEVCVELSAWSLSRFPSLSLKKHLWGEPKGLRPWAGSAAGLGGAVRNPFWPYAVAAASRLEWLNNFMRLWVAATNFHSLSAAASPRRLKRRKPRASLI